LFFFDAQNNLSTFVYPAFVFQLACSFRHTLFSSMGKQVGFKMFLGINAEVKPESWSSDGKECSIYFVENPLTEYVELPKSAIDLW
jgi:hypothetical protein